MIKVKDGYAKLIGTTYQGSATQVLLSNGGDLEYSASSKASTLVQRNDSQHIYATYFNSAISDEALTDIGSVYVRNTSDTFIRRISKTQFYSIIDNKFVTLDTAQTITGVKTFSTGPILADNATIAQKQYSASNYTTVVEWLKGGTSQGTYNPSIGQHNTGGDGTGSICILPYPTSTDPWVGTVGLFIGKGVLRLDGKAVAIAENYYTKTESDERYMTGTRYWANIAVSTSSSTSTSPTFSTAYTSNWFRSTGSTGWYSQTYGGGWYMVDSTWIRTFGSKSVYQDTGQIRTDGYLVTNGGITVGATSPNNGTYKSHVTGNSWSSGYIRAGAGFYHNSVNSNSYVLLAGGSYKSLADFAKGDAGASNRGVYVTNGTVTAMTYYLNATVNSGASGKLAYYSGTNSIDDYTNTIGSSSTPIYINNGIPNAANSYEVVNSGHYFSAFGISGYIYVIRYGQVVCVSINMSSGGNGSTGTTTLLTNLPSAVYTTGQSASKGGGSALRWATFYVSGTMLYVYSYQANELPNKVSFTYITNTLE